MWACGVALVAVVAAAAVAAHTLGNARAQDAPSRRPAELPDLSSPFAVERDASGSIAGLAFSDLVGVSLAREGGMLVAQAEMKREIVDGMFTALVLDFDCDGRESDTELQVRSAVGSRYRPFGYVPHDGCPAPSDLRQASWASPFDEKRGPGGPRIGMTNWNRLEPPTFGGRRLRLRFPETLILDRGGRSSTSGVSWRATLSTTCAEHPVVFDYDALDVGRAVIVDGQGGEWSGGPYAEDDVGELHDVLSHLDVSAVWCEHSADRVFVRVDFAAPGFGTIPRDDGDIVVTDRMTVRLEPRGAAYMDAVQLTVPATQVSGKIGESEWRCGDALVEVSLPRNPKQTGLRVVVWTDGGRYDVLGSGWLPLTPAKKRAR